MEIRFSFHNHSVFSNDKFLKNETPRVILQQIYRDKIGFIAITDARQDIFFDYVIKNMQKYSTICKIEPINRAITRLTFPDWVTFLLRGMEKHDFKGHLLIIGADTQIEYKKNYSVEDWINFTHDHGGICGAAHPISRYVGGMGTMQVIKYAEKLDFIESFNAQLVFDKKANLKAEKISKKYHIPGIATSDSHNHKNIAKSYFYTLGNSPENIAGIQKMLNEGKYINKKSYISYWELAKTYIIGRL